MLLTNLDSPIQGTDWGQNWTKKSKFGSLVTAEISVLQNALNGICTTMKTTCGQNFSSIRRCLLELLPTKTPKQAQIRLNHKNVVVSSG